MITTLDLERRLDKNSRSHPDTSAKSSPTGQKGTELMVKASKRRRKTVRKQQTAKYKSHKRSKVE